MHGIVPNHGDWNSGKELGEDLRERDDLKESDWGGQRGAFESDGSAVTFRSWLAC